MSTLDLTAIVSRPFALIGILGALLMVAAVGLWAHFGTAVFFEVLRAGWTVCF